MIDLNPNIFISKTPKLLKTKILSIIRKMSSSKLRKLGVIILLCYLYLLYKSK